MNVVTRVPCRACDRHSRWVSATPSGNISHIATSHPAAASCSASSRPMPEPPPVTTAIFPAKLFMPISFLTLVGLHTQARRDIAAEGKQEYNRRQHINNGGSHHRVPRSVGVSEQLALRHRNGHVSRREQHGLVQIVVPGEQQRVDGNYCQRRRHQSHIYPQIQLDRRG